MENLLLKKLLVKPGNTVLVDNAPENIGGILGSIPEEADIHFSAKKEVFPIVLLFVAMAVDLQKAMRRLIKNIDSNTIVWVVYPKKTSGMATDLGMNVSWDFLNEFGYQPVASAAINEAWSALRIRLASQTKKSGISNEDIQKNEFSAFIDPEKKTVTIPPDVLEALQTLPEELAYFNQLAYSHRKEYLLWILTAKKEETRNSRIEKMMAMLKERKKNPTDK